MLNPGCPVRNQTRVSDVVWQGSQNRESYICNGFLPPGLNSGLRHCGVWLIMSGLLFGQRVNSPDCSQHWLELTHIHKTTDWKYSLVAKKVCHFRRLLNVSLVPLLFCFATATNSTWAHCYCPESPLKLKPYWHAFGFTSHMLIHFYTIIKLKSVNSCINSVCSSHGHWFILHKLFQ